MRRVYLDNNATTPVDPDVLAAMWPYLTDRFGNASSPHGFGTPIAEAVRKGRRRVRDLLGASNDHEIVFTSGGTESDNTAILSALAVSEGRDEVVTSVVEHPALLALCAYLERHRGVRVHRIAVDERGRLDLDGYRAALGPRTAIASIMWANNETGTLFPVTELAAQAHEVGAQFHTDGVQVAGRLKIDVAATQIDMLSLSGHKLHGPKGIGALYVRKGTPFQPLIRGGQQERGRRGGTENVPGIVGLGQAAKLAAENLDRDAAWMQGLRDRLEQGILHRVPGCWPIGDLEHRLANTTNIVFDGAEAEPILAGLDKAGVAVSSGSACASGSMEPSHVVRAMGVRVTAAHGSIRFSPSRENVGSDIDVVLEVLPGVVERSRAVSIFARDTASAVPA